MKAEDKRKVAHNFYDLYLAQNLLESGDNKEALDLLRELETRFRPIDRLAKARTLALALKALKDSVSFNLFGTAVEASADYMEFCR